MQINPHRFTPIRPFPVARFFWIDRVEWRSKPTKIVDESIEVERAPVFDEEAGLMSDTML